MLFRVHRPRLIQLDFKRHSRKFLPQNNLETNLRIKTPFWNNRQGTSYLQNFVFSYVLIQQFFLKHYFRLLVILDLRIGSCLACVYRVMDARGKLRRRKKRKPARGAAESNSSFSITRYTHS